MWFYKLILVAAVLYNNVSGYTTQRPSQNTEEYNPLIDVASVFIREALAGQNGNSGNGDSGSSLASVASLLGSFMQTDNENGNSKASGGLQMLSTLGSLFTTNNNGNNEIGGIDSALIGNVIGMLTNNDVDDNDVRSKRNVNDKKNSGIGLESIMQIASMFMSSQNTNKRSINNNDIDNDGNSNPLASLLPMVMQTISSFIGPEGRRTEEKHKGHAWALPPYLENIHVMWDHFANSELADALYEKSGVNTILKGFRGRDGKVNYEKLLESLHNQSFRRRWIKAATLYLADWANYITNPDIYVKYIQTVQVLFNGFLKAQGYPKTTFFDSSRPSETISNLIDYIAKHHLNVRVDSRVYVKPAVGYAKNLIKLGQTRGLLQQFNSTELSDQLTDTLNLEVIEPFLKIHRAYQYISKVPQCDKYVLCTLNSKESYNDNTSSPGLVSSFKPRVVQLGSMGAAILISTEGGSSFWALMHAITNTDDCEANYPADCRGFHEGEARVKMEYIHNEL